MAIQLRDPSISQVFVSFMAEESMNGVAHSFFDQIKAQRAAEQRSQSDIGKLEEIPGPLMGGKGEMGLDEHITANLQHSLNLHCSDPRHIQMLENCR